MTKEKANKCNEYTEKSVSSIEPVLSNAEKHHQNYSNLNTHNKCFSLNNLNEMC